MADRVEAPDARVADRADRRAVRHGATAQRPPAGGGLSNAATARLARARDAERAARDAGAPGEADPRRAVLRREADGAAVAFAPPSRPSARRLAVSRPADPAEREAEDVAVRVVRGPAPTAARPAAREEAADRSAADRSAVPRVAERPGGRLPADRPAAARDVRTGAPPTPETVAAGGELPVSADLERTLASPGPGEALGAGLRARIEPHLGADLGGVRVHRGPAAAGAAAELQARAFTVGSDIFLGEGESPADLGLMAHESTHVVQQAGTGPHRATVHRDVLDYIPDFVLDGVRDLPGYGILSAAVGKDVISGEEFGPADLVERLLTFGPFGDAVAPLLESIDVIGDVVRILTDGLAEHDLTLARVWRDLEAAWDEMDVLDGIDDNVAIVARYVRAFLDDVRAFVSDIVGVVMAKVREVVADVAEPLLRRPEVAPYWDLAIKVFHHDPLRGEDVDAPTVEILADFLRLIGKGDAVAQMTERGTLQQTADWLDQQWGRFSGLLAQAGALFADAWAALSPENLPNLLDTLRSLAERAFTLVQDVGRFARDVATEVLVLVKQSLLGMLSQHARRVPGFDLLTVILEQDPFTGERVPRTAENLIRGFITLLPGGDAMYAQLAESGVIAEAAGRIQGAMADLDISWDLVTGIFRGIWDAVSLESLLSPFETFDRILDAFGEPLGRLVRFVAVVIEVVITLILRMMNFPSELLGNIVANASAAIDDIMKDPIGFLRNVVGAMKAGFESFFGNIVDHLLRGLGDWLFRGLRGLGIEPPTSFTAESVITLVVQVLGITVETLWTKLADRIGPERVAQIRAAMDTLTGAWSFLKDVQERGIAAVWEFIAGQLGNLWETILTTAKDWIMREVVDRVVGKLLSMLDPTGVMAIINGTIAFFNAVQSAIEYFREMLEIVDGYVSTIAAVARGDVAPGAAMLERGLAGSIPVAIGFLANQVGLGNVPEKVQEIIESLRALVDQALDWLFDQAMALGQAALAALGGGGAATPEGTADSARSQAVKARATELLQERTARSFATKVELQAVADGVLTELRPEGLHEVTLTESDQRPGTYDIYVAASASQLAASKSIAGMRPPFILWLPVEKEPHLQTYRDWLGRLQSDPAYDRGAPAQRRKWHQALRIGGGRPATSAVYERAHAMGLVGEGGEERVRIPNWARDGSSVQMEVDHIIELQVAPPAMRTAFDDFDNYELLDDPANGRSGAAIRASISAERAIQAAFDPSLETQVLTFDKVELGSGQPGKRWSLEEIQAGEHLDSYPGA